MIYLDSSTDSILPYGLKGTPFETVFKALQAVASTVWPVDAAELRGAIGWGWYLDNNLEELILLSAGKQYIQNISISEQIPLIKSTQTQEELVDLLYRWKSYKPTFDKLEELYIPYAARVDIRPITDEATQEILPVTDIHNAFYVVLTDIDWSRPLTLGEAALIAERATPMGSRPIAVFQFEETTNVHPQLVYGDVNFYTGTFESAAEPIPPVPQTELAYIIVDEDTGEIVFSQNDPGMEFAEVGTLLMPDSEMIICVELGVPVEEFWLGANGRSSTEDVTLQAGNKQYLRSEDGQIITDAGTIELYDQAPALAYIKADGNIYEAASGDYAFENERYPGSGEDLSLYTVDTGSTRSAWAALVEKKDLVLKVKWGDTVNVPSGLKVSEVRTFVGYAFKSYFGDFSGDSSKIVAFHGKNVYFDNIPSHAMLSVRTYSDDPTSKWPLVEVFQTTGQHLVGKYLTVGYKNAIPEWVTQDWSTNGADSTAGEYSVYLRGNNTTEIINAINSGYPVRYLWFVIDDQGNACWWKSPEAFRVPHELWSFSHGTFSWLGNSEDITSLAWWYKHDWELFEWEEFDGAWIYIHCVRDENPEPPAPSELTAYFTNQGSSATRNRNIGNGSSNYNLFNADGSIVDASEYVTSDNYADVPWTIIGGYNYNGDSVAIVSEYRLTAHITNGQLTLSPNHNITGYHAIYTLVYRKS